MSGFRTWHLLAAAFAGALIAACLPVIGCETDDDCAVSDAGADPGSDAGVDAGSCESSCSGRVCGDDGCGGQCGVCTGGLTCSAEGQCFNAACTGRVCGSDGDGGTCGTCNPGSFCNSAGACLVGQLEWAGRLWNVRTGTGGPGPNPWDRRNVFVDENGDLHLTLQKRDGVWTSSEVWTQQRLGFGDFTWYVEGQLDTLDRNVVLGLFTYPTADVGPDTTNEIDIEFARWGSAGNNPLNYTVWPADDAIEPTGTTWPMSLSGTFTTHRFRWRSDRIDFDSHHGHRLDGPSQLAAWAFTPADAGTQLPRAPVPVHLNLWLFQGRAPTNDAGVEVIFHGFDYVPAP